MRACTLSLSLSLSLMALRPPQPRRAQARVGIPRLRGAAGATAQVEAAAAAACGPRGCGAALRSWRRRTRSCARCPVALVKRKPEPKSAARLMSVHGSPTAQIRRGDAPCRPNFHERKQAELRARADEWHASPLYMCARLSLNSGYSADLVPMEGLGT